MGKFLDVLKAINPVDAIASLGSSVINAYSQHETNKANAEQNDLSREFSAQQSQLDRDFNAAQSDKQNAFNAVEAQKSRVFNADQAAQQMAFQEKMWNAQNEYNDPSAQIARLKAAGINPNWSDGLDNTAGSVSGGAAATSSPASGSPASHGSVGAPSNIPMAPVTIDNPLMMGAQIRLANSQAKLNEANTDESKERAEDIRQLRQGKLDLQNVEIHCGLATERFTEQQLRNAFKESLRLDKEMQISEQSLRNMQQELANMKLQGSYTAKELESFDKRLQSQIALALAQEASQYGMANVSKKQCELLAAQITHQSIENGLISIDFGKAFAGAPSSTGLLISSNESEQSYYDWASGDWFNKIWGSDASVPRKLWKTATSYGNWLTHSIGVGMNGSFNMRENKTTLQSVK